MIPDEDIAPLVLLATVAVCAVVLVVGYVWPIYGHLNAVLVALGLS